HQLGTGAVARRIQNHHVDPAAAGSHPVGDVGGRRRDLGQVLQVLGGVLGGSAVALDGDHGALVPDLLGGGGREQAHPSVQVPGASALGSPQHSLDHLGQELGGATMTL